VHKYSVHVRTSELPGFYKKLAIQMFQVFVFVFVFVPRKSLLLEHCFTFRSVLKEIFIIGIYVSSALGMLHNLMYVY